MQDILINWTPQETRVAMVENGAIQELHLERSLERGRVGNVYLGKVVRVLPGMQSAFVEIGLERAAFLHVADLHSQMAARLDQGAAAPVAIPIERLVFEGQSLMVQVLKDPIGTKGARLSTQISIAGRLLVYLPQDRHIGISQKIESEQVREHLRERVLGLAMQAAQAEHGHVEGGLDHGGYILRTNAEDAGDAELAADIAYLRRTWASIRQRSHRQPPGTLLHQDLTLSERVLRDMCNEDTNEVRIDSRLQFEHLQAFGASYTPGTVDKLKHYQGERPIFDLHNIDEEVSRALHRRVDLKCGGYLVIDQTEALIAVDVNTGGFVGGRNFEDTIFKTNLEAAGAIARQLRLRNLGGIIIVDFIDMTRDEHRHAVLAELHKQLARDRSRTTVGDFTKLGLLELTRKRTRESLSQQLCEPCPTCEGRGHVKTARTVCYDVLREILREARRFQPREFRVVASPAVVEMLLDEESVHLAGLSEFIGKPISLMAEPSMSPEQYDIVLM